MGGKWFVLCNYFPPTVSINDKTWWVIKWKHFSRYWPFMRGTHRSPVNSPHKCQWRGDLMFSLVYVWTNGWVNNRDAGDLRRHRFHYDVTAMDFDDPTGQLAPPFRHALLGCSALSVHQLLGFFLGSRLSYPMKCLILYANLRNIPDIEYV